MLNFTKQERLVLVFLGFASLAGLVANLFFKNSCSIERLYLSASHKKAEDTQAASKISATSIPKPKDCQTINR
jgi:hypothetical protein